MRTGFLLNDAHWVVVQQGLPEGLVDTQWVSGDPGEATEFVSVGGLDLVVVEASEKFLTADLVQAADRGGIMLAALITHAGAEQWADQRGVGHRLYQPEDLLALVAGKGGSPLLDASPDGVPGPQHAAEPGSSLPQTSRRGTLTVFWGPHGAPGATTLCVSTASVLARQGLSVCLVDADARGGVISPALGVLDPIPGFLAAIRLAGKGELNAEHITRLVCPYLSPPTEFSILTGTPRGLIPGEVPRDSLDALIGILRELFDAVLFDTGSDISLSGEDRRSTGADITSHIASRADAIVAVCGVSPAGVARFARALPELESQAVGTPVRVWLNGVDTSRRAVGDDAMLREALWRFAGLSEYAALPRDTSLFLEAERKALSPIDVNPQSGFAHALRHELATFTLSRWGEEDTSHTMNAPPAVAEDRARATRRGERELPVKSRSHPQGPPEVAKRGFPALVANLRRRWLKLTALR
ncbi:fimbriae localization ATPase TadZ [Pontimonas salivibrio]|uniref:Fimbriae localization ATPase TadZ n=1 Tax=Pontimonas salivibrio TaxID=1159327 RepID=A0A2L2BSC1_9MICO|nr:hypothetical protein [Pontimonas salivibrio]AVG24540.1 fimbriae localization ATPase TadZ [Pontimonas salivibrio]